MKRMKFSYWCRPGWGYPSSGANETFIRCLKDGTWSNTQPIENCIRKFCLLILISNLVKEPALSKHFHLAVLPCPNAPPPATSGEGAERIFGTDITYYRCKNGYMWETGRFDHMENHVMRSVAKVYFMHKILYVNLK
jgi:hypothetical protein